MSEKSQTIEQVTFARPPFFSWRSFGMPSLPMVILIIVVGFLVLTPLFLMILNSFQTARPGQPIARGLEGWVKAFSTPGIVKAITNTFTLAITRQALALVIVWAPLGGSVSVKVMLLAPAFRNLDAAFEEASKISGASGWHTFFPIVIPVMMPAILVTTILGIIRSLEAFEIELLLGTPIGLQVYSTKIHELVTWEPPQFAPAMALSTVFLGVLLLMVALQRNYIGQRNYETVSGRGFSIRSTPLGHWRYPAFFLVLAFAMVVTIVPTALLLIGTFMKLFGFFNIADPWTLENWRATLSDPVLMRSLWNTLAIGIGSGVTGVLFYALIAYMVVKTRHAGRWLLDFLSWLPWSIPGILLGVAL